MLDERQPPDTTKVVRNSTTLTASFTFGNRVRHVTVKQMQPRVARLCVSELFRVQRAIADGSDLLANHMPKFYDFHPQHNLVAMEFVPGQTLHKILKRNIDFRVGGDVQHLRQIPDLLRRIHGLSASDVKLPSPQRCNESFVADFELWSKDRLIQRQMQRDTDLAQRLLECLSKDFFSRTVDQVLPIDCQPKNILVRKSGQLCLIDLDFAIGNPAMSVAFFLVSLDQLRLRNPTPGADRRISDMKRVFVDAYLDSCNTSVAEDLLFFYPWALLQAMRTHIGYRNLAARYLARCYTKPLKQFLSAIERQRRGAATEFSAELFAAKP